MNSNLYDKKPCSCCGSLNENDRIYIDLSLFNLEKEDVSPLKEKKEDTPVVLCNHCISKVNLGLNHVQDKLSVNNSTSRADLSKVTPKEVYEEFNQHIVGQDTAKRAFSIAIAQHYRKINDDFIDKSNLLVFGPTGSGKTELARVASKFLNVPFLITDASSYTAAGYMGDSVEDIIKQLYMQCNGNIEDMKNAIVFIDEMDKITNAGGNSAEEKSHRVKTTDVQRELLKVIEGKNVTLNLPTPDGRGMEHIVIDTTNILFICAGAFEGLKEIVVERHTKTKRSIGLSSSNNEENKVNEDNWVDFVDNKDLVQYGFIPEFLGRLPIKTHTNKLDEEALIKILTEPKRSIVNQFKKLYAIDDIELSFSKEYLTKVAKQAIEENVGARGLRSILEKDLESYYFELDKHQKNHIKL